MTRQLMSRCPVCGGSVLESGTAHHWPGCPRGHAVQERRELAALAAVIAVIVAGLVLLLVLA
jgi:uncharacterized protein (DUF983 family)